LWQLWEQNQNVDVTPITGIMTAMITMTATTVQMMYRGRRTGSLNPAREIFAMTTLLA
jgi:heme/copper-type cytochrome/quinol oxidase subunit 3